MRNLFPRILLRQAAHASGPPAGWPTLLAGPALSLLLLGPAGGALAQSALTLTSTTPARNAVAGSRTANVSLVFDRTLTPGTVGNVRLFSAQRNGQLVRGGNATASGSTLTVDPAQDLRPGETVFVTVPTTIAGAGGNAAKQVFQFTAAAGVGPGTFSGTTDVSMGTGAGPISVVTADVDGDGDLDLLTANNSSNTVGVRFNDGSGAFSGTTTVAVGNSPVSVAAADVDGDGDLDLLTASSTSGTVSVRINNGSGTFSGTTNVAVGANTRSVAAADVDGDGDLDLLAANTTDNTVSVRLNNGSGAFSGTTDVPVGKGNDPLSVVAADVDGDGDLDLLTANSASGANSVSVNLNNGNGIFSAAPNVAVGSRPLSVVAADVDGDGDLDLLTANQGSSNSVSVRFNNGSGTFSGTTNVAVGASPEQLAAADVDGDGDLDILTASSSGGTVSIRLNNGSGTFSGTTEVPVGTSPRSVAAADVDGDGDLDILTANLTASTVSVRLNQAAAPTLTSLSPNFGAVGSTISLTGTNLTGATAITFAGTSGNVVTTGFTVASATSITGVVVPAGASTGNVTVTTPGGTSNGVNFTVTAAPTVTTTAPAGITPTGATLGGNVTADGGAFVPERGVVYVAGSGTPTTSNTKVVIGSGTGSYALGVMGLAAGTQYTVRAYATNAAGTSYGASQTFTTTAVLSASIGSRTNVSCFGGATGAATVTVSGGTTPYTYSWNTTPAQTTATATGLAAGTYTVTVTDATNQTTTAQATITQPATALSATTGKTDATTNGGNDGTATVTPAGGTPGYTYLWSNGANTPSIFGLTAGTYSVTVTDANGCTTTGSATVGQPAAAPQDLTISTGTPAAPVAIAAGTYNNVTITGTGVAQLGGAVTVNGTFLVQGSLNTNCQPLTGPGSFTLAAGATLAVCSAQGLTSSGATGAVQLTGIRSFSPDADYVYNGTGAQITGNGLPAQVRNLTSTNSNTVTLSQPVAIRQALTLNAGSLNTNGQALTLRSDATGTALIANLGTGVVSGVVTVQRYIDPSLNPGLGYRHLAAPTVGAIVASFGTGGTTPVVNSAYNTAADPGAVTPFPTVYYYDQARLASSPATTLSAFDKGWTSPNALTDAASLAARGFTVQLPGASTLSFTGQVGNGNGSILLGRNSGATAPDAGWNLIGNPYPSPLDFSTIPAGQRINMDAAFYTFESTSQYGGSYRSYVNGIGNPLIGSSQGFFVRVSAGQTSGSLTLNNANRVTTYAQQAPVRRGTADSRPLLQLQLAGATGPADDLFVYAQAGATAGLDAEFDAAKLPNSSGLNLASLSAAGQQLAIDGRPAFATATTVPLFVGVPATGRYTFTAASLANLAGIRAELVDNLTGTRTVLAPGTSYGFTMTGFTAPGRFWLNLTPAAAPLATSPAALAAQVQLYPNPSAGLVTVLRPATGPASAEVLNALGQVVHRAALPTAETALDLRQLPSGVYLLRLSVAGQPVTKRLVID